MATTVTDEQHIVAMWYRINRRVPALLETLARPATDRAKIEMLPLVKRRMGDLGGALYKLEPSEAPDLTLKQMKRYLDTFVEWWIAHYAQVSEEESEKGGFFIDDDHANKSIATSEDQELPKS